MKTKNWLILLASCVALASAPMMGCGDDSDPSGNNNNNNDAADVVSDDDTDDEGTPDTDDEGTPDTDDEGDPDVDDGDPDVDEGETDTNNTPSDCVPNDVFTGQAYAAGSDAHNGGNPVDAASVTLDAAGLSAIDSAVENGEALEENDYIITLEEPLQVTGALVIGTGRTDNATTTEVIEGNDWLFLQDADTVIVLNAGPGKTAFPSGEEPTEAVKVGDKVSFSVNAVNSYAGVSQAVLVEGFSIDSSGNDVPFTDLTGQDVSLDLLGKLVRVSGELTADNGGCGGSSICYTLSHGDKQTAFRSNSTFISVGSCVTFFGPLGSFDDAAQLNEVNWAWTSTN